MRKFKLFLTLLTLVIFGSGQMWGGVSGTYNLASSVSAGDVIIIVNADNTYALKSLTTGNKPYGDYSSVTCTDGVITLSNANVEELNVVTGNANGSFSFQGTEAISGYLNHSGSNNTLNSNAQKSNNTSWTIAIDATSKDATIANVATTTRVMRFNTNSGQERFACYTSATGTLVHIFKKQVASCSDNPIVGNIMNDVSSITASSATFTTSAGVSAGTNCTLSEVGFVYGTSTEPTITSGTKAVIDNYESGNLNKAVTGLDDNTTYYVRAFATNGHGTAYSDEKSFTTPELAKYTVQFSTGEGNPTKDALTEASAGAGITLPTAVTPHCSGWTFAGWSETNVVSETTTAPTTLLAAGSTYHPASNCTLYAVYSRSETGDPTEQSIKTIGFESTEGFSSVSSYQNSTPYTGGSNPEWSMTYGGPCAASGAARTGSQTAQFRIYSSGGGFGELKTTGSFANVTKFTFYAKTANTTNTKLTTYYSTDGSTWTTLTADRSIASSYTPYTETINVEGVNSVYIKFSPTGSTRPASSNYAISIDDIEVFGMVTSSTTYYLSETTCCSPLGQINGSFFWTIGKGYLTR